MCLLSSIYARERVEICGKPAAVLRDQFGNEISAGIGTHAYQIAPDAFSARAARYRDMAGPEANAAPVEIQHGSIRSKALQARRLAGRNLGVGIHLRERPIEAR